MSVQYGMTRAKRASCLNTDDSWMYEDGADEILFSVDQECQLLGIGLCGTEGAFTAEVDLREVPACFPCVPHVLLCCSLFVLHVPLMCSPCVPHEHVLLIYPNCIPHVLSS